MRRKCFVATGSILILAGLLFASLSFASATPATSVSGTWGGFGQVASNLRAEGGNVFVDVYNKGIYTAGDILGNFEQTFTMIIHYGSPKVVQSLDPNNPASHPPSPFNWVDMDRVFVGTVLGHEGGFTMRLQAKGYGNAVAGIGAWNLEGTWVIIGGTGGLAGLHGQGTWSHTAGIPGLQYEGQVHFDP